MDYQIELAKQLKFIKTSCESYDKGETIEALRIAVALRVLFHDTKNSTSVLALLKKNDDIHLITTIGSQMNHEEYSKARMIFLPLMLTMSGVDPILDKHKSSEVASIDVWWNEIVFAPNFKGFSRKDIVLAAANQDGGAHVDPNQSKKTKDIKSSTGIFSRTVAGVQIKQELTDHHIPILRQLGYEVLNSPMLINLTKPT